MEDGDVTGPGMQCCLCFVLSCNIEGIGLCYWNHQNNVWRQVDVCTGDRNGNNSDLQFSLDLKVAVGRCVHRQVRKALNGVTGDELRVYPIMVP